MRFTCACPPLHVYSFTVELAPPLGQENISPNDATPAASVGPLPSSLPNKRRKTQPPDQPLGGSQVQESPSAGDFVGINAMHVHNEVETTGVLR